MESGLAVSSVNTSRDCFAIEFPGSFFEALEASDRSLALGRLQFVGTPGGDHSILPALRRNSTPAT